MQQISQIEGANRFLQNTPDFRVIDFTVGEVDLGGEIQKYSAFVFDLTRFPRGIASIYGRYLLAITTNQNEIIEGTALWDRDAVEGVFNGFMANFSGKQQRFGVFFPEIPSLEGLEIVRIRGPRFIVVLSKEVGASVPLGKMADTANGVVFAPYGQTFKLDRNVSPSDYPFKRFRFEEESIRIVGFPQQEVEGRNFTDAFFPGSETQINAANSLTVGRTGYFGTVNALRIGSLPVYITGQAKFVTGEELDLAGARSIQMSGQILPKLDMPISSLFSIKNLVNSLTTQQYTNADVFTEREFGFLGDSERDTYHDTVEKGHIILRNFPYYVGANIPSSVLERVIVSPNAGGPIMLRLLIPVAAGDATAGERRDVFCWVYPLQGSSSANCLICFNFRGTVIDQGHPLFLYSFLSAQEAFATMGLGTATFEYSIPEWNMMDGHPQSVSRYRGRTVFTGQRGSSGMLFTAPAPQSAYKLNTYLPAATLNSGDDLEFTPERVESIRSSGKDLAASIPPNPLDGEEAIYWYLFQLLASTGLTPGGGDIDLTTNANIKWLANLRGGILGSARNELQMGNITNDIIQLGHSHSYRGSSSSIVAAGDYSIYFIGRNRRDIFTIFYDENIRGFRSKLATRDAPTFDADVKDMRWDFNSRCLWVLLKNGQIFKHFLSTEYGIDGWARFTTRVPNMGAWQFANFIDEIGIIYRDFSAQGFFRIYRVRNDSLFDTWNQVGSLEQEVDIESRVNLFKMAPPGEQGETSMWMKDISYTSLDTLNTRQLLVGDTLHPVTGFKGIDVPEVIGETRIDIEGLVESARTPVLKIEHQDRRKAIILGTSSKIVVREQ